MQRIKESESSVTFIKTVINVFKVSRVVLAHVVALIVTIPMASGSWSSQWHLNPFPENVGNMQRKEFSQVPDKSLWKAEV